MSSTVSVVVSGTPISVVTSGETLSVEIVESSISVVTSGETVSVNIIDSPISIVTSGDTVDVIIGEDVFEVVIGESETDPIFRASPASSVTLGDITNLGNLSGVNTGDQDLSPYLTDAPIDGSLYGRKDGGWDVSASSSLLVDTESVILGTSPSSPSIAYATDTQFFYVADGTDWRRASLKFYTDSANPDMGYLQNNSKDGYYAAFITSKSLYNICIKGFTATPQNGAIRINTTVDPDTLEIYMRDTGWFTIIYDLSTALGYFVHYPFSITEAVKVWSGMSVEVGLNGRPMINEYDRSMGAYPPPKVINGGTF